MFGLRNRDAADFEIGYEELLTEAEWPLDDDSPPEPTPALDADREQATLGRDDGLVFADDVSGPGDPSWERDDEPRSSSGWARWAALVALLAAGGAFLALMLAASSRRDEQPSAHRVTGPRPTPSPPPRIVVEEPAQVSRSIRRRRHPPGSRRERAGSRKERSAHRERAPNRRRRSAGRASPPRRPRVAPRLARAAPAPQPVATRAPAPTRRPAPPARARPQPVPPPDDEWGFER